jgi:hypothetical protein
MRAIERRGPVGVRLPMNPSPTYHTSITCPKYDTPMKTAQ